MQPGLSLHAILKRCGHEDITMTLGYVKAAEDLALARQLVDVRAHLDDVRAAKGRASNAL